MIFNKKKKEQESLEKKIQTIAIMVASFYKSFANSDTAIDEALKLYDKIEDRVKSGK